MRRFVSSAGLLMLDEVRERERGAGTMILHALTTAPSAMIAEKNSICGR
eukprot:CAMPEP_0175816378 /NCGR_PEP_ID=MMETSP0107_2-20121207/6465_1 /TAXON_ID=195067 ORGANISM="Goniomonas pacifica, Strain CCMP1869" /NCGR_SAMPLE_ID=MMETSP0107_2 /ASSEMBLY_ACC=CAM_ASM_000203 /LENGTH=48 /DNA_ID= /DNA_START= /DNA_END= /DNA_ORIENTATION=